MKRSRPTPGRGCALDPEGAKRQKRLHEEQQSEGASSENEDQIQPGARPQMQGLSAARMSKQSSKAPLHAWAATGPPPAGTGATTFTAVRDGMRALGGAAAGVARAVSGALLKGCEYLLNPEQVKVLEACPVPDGAYIRTRIQHLASFEHPGMRFCDDSGIELVQTFVQLFLYLRSLGQAM